MEDISRGGRESPLPDTSVLFGIDAGALFTKVVGLDHAGRRAFHDKWPCGEDARLRLERLLTWGRSVNARFGSAGEAFPRNGCRGYDPVVCLRAAARSYYPQARNILEVGASHLTLVRLDGKGRVASVHGNSLCAAGTGSFLDAQAARMGIAYDEPLAKERLADPPSIATRCAVFAKSDLIYRQQEGFSRQALWSGLCRGLADSLLHALTRGRSLAGTTVLCGGVALNATLVEWLRVRLAEHSADSNLVIMPRPEYAAALGAALLAGAGEPAPRTAVGPDAAPGRKRRPELRLDLSKHPGPKQRRPKRDDTGNEVTMHEAASGLHGRGDIDVFLGLDIGSTSTKLVLVDIAGRVITDIYRPTGADPLEAVWKLFRAVRTVSRDLDVRFAVRRAATTGSGRKLVGTLVGADLVVNEITAHVMGAVRTDPSVETIFEIGGQDAKYMAIRDGGIVDANMNYVCAAGTGSFVEEQASRLGYTIDEIGDAALGTSPPYTSNRCTVFMEQDIMDLVAKGATRREAAGAVMYSVIDNYLAQVVGPRPVSSPRVFFQGATARNRGLVAALEQTLGMEVVVSPLCHVLGAYGAALLATGSAGEGRSRFRGFDLGDRDVIVREYECGLCDNRCRLSRAEIEGEEERPVWGMKCGRDVGDLRRRDLKEYALFERAARLGLPSEPGPGAATAGRPIIRIPRALTMYADHPFWLAFFDALGVSVELGPAASRRSLDLGRTFSGPDFCLPLKAAVGQVAELLGRDDGAPVFVPFFLADYASPRFSHSRLCPYVEALPAMARAALGGNGLDLRRLISPIVDLRHDDGTNAAALAEAFSAVFRMDSAEIKRALGQAHKARRNHESGLVAGGRAALEKARADGRPAIVVVGRPYSLFDPLLNHDVPRTLARCGVEAVPMTCLEHDPRGLAGELTNLFWTYGQRMMAVLDRVARTDGLYALVVSNFGCGPDSFLLSYGQAIMGDKPLLVLEIDEHGAAGGYETRIEAFVDVVRGHASGRRKAGSRRALPREPAPIALKGRTLWFPQMHPVGNRFLVAAFRSEGQDARTLPLEDEGTLALGKKWTRGAECLPMALTLGAFLDRVDPKSRPDGDDARPPALFMPTSTGPCRYGQYRTLDRMVFERLKLDDVPIISPGAHNAYFGLRGSLRRRAWAGICGGDLLFKMRCRVLPYETTKGDTEEVLERVSRRGEDLVASKAMRWPAFLEEAMGEFLRIPVGPGPRPLVGIVGEIYVRCNPFANGRLVETIERLGGEAWLSPVSEWILYTAWVERYLARRGGGGPVKLASLAAKWAYLTGTLKTMERRLGPLLGDRREPSMDEIMRACGDTLPPEFQGESTVTVGRAVLFGERGADLVVNCAPFGCMHGNITAAVFEQERPTVRVPVVNMSYDGTGDNALLSAFMHEARQRKA